MKHIFLAFLVVLTSGAGAQIFESEGLNMPGSYDGWTNVPTNVAFANSSQAVGGRLTKIHHGQPRWQTIFSAALSGADVIGGSYEFKFSSGPTSDYWNNTWGDGLFMMNTLTTVGYGATSNNSVSFTNGKWYTMNWVDAGYSNTQAIFMETSTQPVALTGVVQSPLNGNVEPTAGVTLTVSLSAAPGVEERVYVRYSTDGFATSAIVPVSFASATGNATIPAQAASTIVQYYVFTTTMVNPSIDDVDKVTIRTLTNGGAYFYYTVNSPVPLVQVTFQVDMNQVTIDPAGVFIAGSFNGFSNQPMTNAGSGIYTYMASLPQGAVIQYTFKNGINGGEGNQGAPCGNGVHRVYSVGNSDSVLGVVCFNSCVGCPATHPITFRVNMSSESVVGDVYVNGNFPPANWTNPQLMTNEGAGIYSYTVALGAGNVYQYKFMNGSSYEVNLSAPCGNGTNRILQVPAIDTSLPVTCFGYCNDCATNAVTFWVDMSSQPIDPSGVFISGSFNGFSNTAMVSEGGGLYSVTLNLQKGTTVQYKFKNGPSGWENNIEVPCGNGVNRVLTVSNSSAQTIPVTCFGSCGACPMFYDVTFAVNMANTNVSLFGVHLTGNFGSAGYANWNPSGINMSDPDGNGVFTATLSLPAGHVFEYKFINGNDWTGAENIPSDCAASGNRYYQIPPADGLVSGGIPCFGGCTACAWGVINDSPYTAATVLYSSNVVYPNCHTIQGNATAATDSPQSTNFGGKDVWYKFVAQSSGVSITLMGASQDDAIALYRQSGTSFIIMTGGIENSSSGVGDFERLNYTGLTPGHTYFVSVGGATANDGGLFTLCIQHLMPTYCNYAIPASGFNLCNAYKSTYRGSSSQGVSYTYSFTGVGGGAAGTSTFTGGNLILLSNPTLGLRYGGMYDVQIDVNYGLQDGAGAADNIVVLGSNTALNCNDVSMMIQPEAVVRTEQRCDAALTRGTYLNAARATTAALCGVSNYTYEFTQVTSCTNSTLVSAFPLTFTTAGASPYLKLSVLPNLGNTGAWNVRIRPNFAYGDGSYGTVYRIQVAGTSASGELLYEMVDTEKAVEVEMESASVYPNPSNGESVNLALSGLQKGRVQVRVLDAAGRAVTTRVYTVEGSLTTTLVFDEKLSAGVYMMEMTNEGNVKTERLVVQ